MWIGVIAMASFMPSWEDNVGGRLGGVAAAATADGLPWFSVFLAACLALGTAVLYQRISRLVRVWLGNDDLHRY